MCLFSVHLVESIVFVPRYSLEFIRGWGSVLNCDLLQKFEQGCCLCFSSDDKRKCNIGLLNKRGRK